jgi:hypothetical protein
MTPITPQSAGHQRSASVSSNESSDRGGQNLNDLLAIRIDLEKLEKMPKDSAKALNDASNFQGVIYRKIAKLALQRGLPERVRTQLDTIMTQLGHPDEDNESEVSDRDRELLGEGLADLHAGPAFDYPPVPLSAAAHEFNPFQDPQSLARGGIPGSQGSTPRQLRSPQRIKDPARAERFRAPSPRPESPEPPRSKSPSGHATPASDESPSPNWQAKLKRALSRSPRTLDEAAAASKKPSGREDKGPPIAYASAEQARPESRAARAGDAKAPTAEVDLAALRLEHVMARNHPLRVRFMAFCRGEESDQNPDFLSEVAELGDQPSPEMIRRVYDTYLSPAAERPVNVASKLSKGLAKTMDARPRGSDPEMLKQIKDAEKEVQLLVAQDTFRRFKEQIEGESPERR